MSVSSNLNAIVMTYIYARSALTVMTRNIVVQLNGANAPSAIKKGLTIILASSDTSATFLAVKTHIEISIHVLYLHKVFNADVA